MEQKHFVLDILTNPHILENLKLQLQILPIDDPVFTILSNVFTQFRVDKAPNGIHQIDILHSIFQFSNPEDSFVSFQFVCKSWNRAFQTLRFNYLIEKLPQICFNLFEEGVFTVNYTKIFEKIQKINIQKIQKSQIHPHDLRHFLKKFATNLQNLTKVCLPEIPFQFGSVEPDEEEDEEIKLITEISKQFLDRVSMDILIRSRNTLQEIHGMWLTLFMCGMKYPNLKTLSIHFQPGDTPQLLQKFISLIPNAAPSLKQISFSFSRNLEEKQMDEIDDYLVSHYGDKFLAGWGCDDLNKAQPKYYFINAFLLTYFDFITQNTEFQLPKNVEFLCVDARKVDNECEEIIWENFKQFLEFWPNLKQIAIALEKSKELSMEQSENMTSERLNIVKNLIEESNVEFVTTNEIRDKFRKEKENKLIFDFHNHC